jgi:CDP-paratose 2-epimerase
MQVLVTGGAGFVGSSLCVALADRQPGWNVTALDNLHRAGSELNVARLREAGVTFVHGDVREPSDLAAVDGIDVLVECSAEPSVLAGLDGRPDYLVQTNLVGAYNCLELARAESASVIFLSTSRVYPLEPLAALALEETDTRFELADAQAGPGVSRAGVSEDFPLAGARTLYGATKLAAELLIAEYAQAYGLRAVVNRCGVIAGPWQMGKVEQGVFAHWLLAHYFGRPLTYIGYGGKQVRDLLHVADLAALIEEQVANPSAWAGATVNVGGGRENSLSLIETTELCREATGNSVPVQSSPDVRTGDVPVYISDCGRLFERTEWRPSRDARTTVEDMMSWVSGHEAQVRSALGL